MPVSYEADSYGADGIPTVIAVFEEGLHEIPNLAIKLGPTPDASRIPSEYTELDKKIREKAIKDKRERDSLAQKHQESQRIYIQGLNDSEELTIG